MSEKARGREFRGEVKGVVMPRPCGDCPFLREGGIRLTVTRAAGLAGNAVDWNGTRFFCHKSYYSEVAKLEKGGEDAEERLYEEDEGGGDGGTVPAPSGVMDCAGSAILGEKAGVMTQALRMAARFGIYDPDGFSEGDRRAVFDSVEEMVECNRKALWGREG